MHIQMPYLLHAGRLMTCDQASFFGESAKVGGWTNRNGQGPPDRKTQRNKQSIRIRNGLCFRQDSIKPRLQPSYLLICLT